jgi:tetratricopeptide (TPR) repeat protein
LISIQGQGQINLDSLFSVWNDPTQADSNRLDAMHDIARHGYVFSQPDSGFYYAQILYDMSKSLGNKEYMAGALNIQGISSYLKSEYDKAIESYSKSLEIFEEIESVRGMASALGNLGLMAEKKGDFDKAIEYYTKSNRYFTEINYLQGVAGTLNNMGLIYRVQGETAKELENFKRSLKIKEEIGDKKGIANSVNNIGQTLGNQGKYAEAINYYNRSLKIYEDINDLRGVASCLDNIGTIYKTQQEFDKALEYYTKSLAINESEKNKNGKAISFNNIGLVYEVKKEFEKAIEYHTKSLKLAEEMGKKTSTALTLGNLGTSYFKQGNIGKALEFYNQSLSIRKEMGDKLGTSVILTNIGVVYEVNGNFNKAITYCSEALLIAHEINLPVPIRDAAKSLARSYSETGKSKQALEMFELYIQLRDSLQSEENQKEVIRYEFKRTYEKQADSLKADQAQKEVLALAEQKRKEVLQKAERKRKDDIAQKDAEKKNLIIWSGAGGLLLVLLFTGFIINRLQITRKQKGIIEEQKDVVELQKEEVEEKNKEIMDSIRYAKRLQEAILPPARLVKEWLPNSFILYKPKDIVAGDFYWMETVEDTIYFAAADCTGHGVPGAMVSVVCSNALTKSLVEENIHNPAKILDRTRELVIAQFGKSDEDVKDGMDIAICALNTKTKALQYAGANNPLWIIRNESNEIEEIKANKQPIGKYAEPKPFTPHTIQLLQGDSIYLFSDGFVDQFGGSKGKKFKAKAFRELLLSTQNQSMDEQRSSINNTFEDWRGELEQIDDVCVIGVKI